MKEKLAEWDAQGGTRRLFAGDATLWTGSDEASWLGWLGIVEAELDDLTALRALQEEVKRGGLHPRAAARHGRLEPVPRGLEGDLRQGPRLPRAARPRLHRPGAGAAVEEKVDLAKTLFIVASKSGSTLEPNIFKAYFFDRVKQAVGAAEAGRRFVAITDPGSSLEKEAKADGFRHVFAGSKTIGGRYSALSNFGMVPAAVMGLDVETPARRGRAHGAGLRSRACRRRRTPGLVLGTILGRLAAARASTSSPSWPRPASTTSGAWLEQLIAESTGKEGKGIIPVDRERLGPPTVYGDDRLFCYLRLEAAPDAAQDAAVAALEAAGQPVVRIAVATHYDLGEEFVRWEIATAIAGSILGINPFNQPDVEASKLATRALTSEYEKTGALPAGDAVLRGRGREALRRRGERGGPDARRRAGRSRAS